MMIAIAFFSFGSALAGTAQNMNMLIAARGNYHPLYHIFLSTNSSL
jgi:hypothetical protein